MLEVNVVPSLIALVLILLVLIGMGALVYKNADALESRARRLLRK